MCSFTYIEKRDYLHDFPDFYRDSTNIGMSKEEKREETSILSESVFDVA